MSATTAGLAVVADESWNAATDASKVRAETAVLSGPEDPRMPPHGRNAVAAGFPARNVLTASASSRACCAAGSVSAALRPAQSASARAGAGALKPSMSNIGPPSAVTVLSVTGLSPALSQIWLRAWLPSSLADSASHPYGCSCRKTSAFSAEAGLGSRALSSSRPPVTHRGTAGSWVVPEVNAVNVSVLPR